MTRRHLWRITTALLLAVACLPGLAQAAPSTGLIIENSSTQTLTQAAPSSSTDGLNLTSVVGFRVTYCAVGGNLQATGKLLAYVYSSTLGAWAHNPDQDLSITVTGEVCQVWSDSLTMVTTGRVKYVASGVTLSAGTTGVVLIQAVVK